VLSQTSLDASQLGSFLERFRKCIPPLLGRDLLARLLSKIPGLGELLS